MESLGATLKLLEVRLRNYRCYRDEISIRFDDLTTLIGRNDSGKSTILEALNLFLNDGVPDGDDACKDGNHKDLAIITVFSEPPSAIILDQDAETTLQGEHLLNPDGHLEIHKIFNGSLDKPKISALKLVANHPAADNVKDLVNLSNGDLKKRADEIGADTTQIDRKVNAQLRASIRAATPELDIKTRDVSLVDGNGVNFWKGIQAHLPAFELFRSDRTSTDQDPEVQDPLTSAIKEAIRKREGELNDIQRFVEAETKKVADLTLEMLKEMDPNLATSLKPECSVKPWASLFKVSITGDSNIPLNKRGSGVRRLILLNFLRAKAQLLRRENKKQSLIYAIEEPETSQHPRSQRLLISVLQELSCTEQVVITTHTPMLARVLPAETLRFVHVRADATREILVGGDDGHNALIANSLGVLPDHNVKLFVGIEGKTDIPFLRNTATMLIAEGENIPNLEELELDGNVVFIPCGGSSLVLWSNRLKALNRPEFHLYDRDTHPPAPPKYIDAMNGVNARAGCIAVSTQKREIENYIHHESINIALRALGINLQFGNAFADFDDVPTILVDRINPLVPNDQKWGKTRAKDFLSNVASRHMTRAMLDDLDPRGEVLGWFREMQGMIERAD
jgi:hypothetical protein